MDERWQRETLMSLVDLYIDEVHQAVEVLREFRGACPECGSFSHDGCLLLDGPEVSREEFSALALASLLYAAGGFGREGREA